MTSWLRWICQPRCTGHVWPSSLFLYPFVLFMLLLLFLQMLFIFYFLLTPMYLAHVCIFSVLIPFSFLFSNGRTSLAHWTCRRLLCIPASAHAVPLCRKPFLALPEHGLHPQAELSLGGTAAITHWGAPQFPFLPVCRSPRRHWGWSLKTSSCHFPP